MFKTKQIVIIALMATIIFVIEQIISFLPNIQLTMFFVVLFSKKYKTKTSIMIVVIYVLLDCIFNGSLNFIIFLPMMIGWIICVLLLNYLFKSVTSNPGLAIVSAILSFIYCWNYMLINCIVYSMDVYTYFVADLPFEILMSGSSFVSVLFLYNKVERIFERNLS